ncbi:hypothetical protein [Bacillus sp. S10(2024)]|uniref:hypothetical protein n=1 Tax=Bacillus sp. S10(2024) TaxID=3162886 RepID=UPI003D1E137D
MKEIKVDVTKTMDAFRQKLEGMFQVGMDLKPTTSNDDKWQFKIESKNATLEFDVWFYNIGHTYDYSLNHKKNEDPVIRINFIEVKPTKIGLGTKVYNEFVSILPDQYFKRILLDAQDNDSLQFWLSLDFIQVNGTYYMYKDLK